MNNQLIKVIRALELEFSYIAAEKIKTMVDDKMLAFNYVKKYITSLDEDTLTHSYNVNNYVNKMASAIGLNSHILDMAALLHDIGKCKVPMQILNKPGKLDEEEFKQIKEHPQNGCDILKDIFDIPAVTNGVLYHHERYDGKGYPYGLSRDNIPIEARIISIADAYDAMTSNRTYQKRMTAKKAIAELDRCAGSQFDPDLVQIFIQAV